MGRFVSSVYNAQDHTAGFVRKILQSVKVFVRPDGRPLWGCLLENVCFRVNRGRKLSLGWSVATGVCTGVLWIGNTLPVLTSSHGDDIKQLLGR